MADALLDDIQSLVCFARVVEASSFSGAARLLGVSKSVVSTRVATLESRLGEQLLMRTTRKVSLTSAGARIYAHARDVVAAGTAAVSHATDAGRGLIRVSAPVSLAQLYLAAPCARFLAGHPGVRLELLLNDRLVDLVEERIDVAIRISKLEDSRLIARRLTTTPIVVCGSPSYLEKAGRPARPEELVRHNCLRYAILKAEHEWRFYSSSGRISLDVSGNFETSNGTVLREAALAGLGLAILPRFMVHDALEDGRLQSVLEDFAPRPLGIYAVRSGRRTAPPVLRDLVRELERTFARPSWTTSTR